MANAFDRIPIARLVDACRQRLPAELVDLLRLVVAATPQRGLHQGSPLSPLLANLFFDHYLDRPWARRASPPLIRTADDLLVICPEEAALDCHETLTGLATSAGTPLKGRASTAVRRLAEGEAVDWLGFHIRQRRSRLAVTIGQRAWGQLGDTLRQCHERPAAAILANQVVRGWIDQMGPCFSDEDRKGVTRRIRRLATDLAFDEIPSQRHLNGLWQRAHARWHKLRQGIEPDAITRFG